MKVYLEALVIELFSILKALNLTGFGFDDFLRDLLSLAIPSLIYCLII
ncbi:hypothetical protein XBP1_2610001 [Xenorhabdus bovienii str. puntauvense]|uniref:Uncharacterized protein n=1 Tax=Xenorhabdus bovienii str. puntauvense TaxID=1398201 RepID=A0A077NG15_XENBV|nr:hypothetical protein XBP1_2610001 [Xenorhabdus bovienii str. puntauvense]